MLIWPSYEPGLGRLPVRLTVMVRGLAGGDRDRRRRGDIGAGIGVALDDRDAQSLGRGSGVGEGQGCRREGRRRALNARVGGLTAICCRDRGLHVEFACAGRMDSREAGVVLNVGGCSVHHGGFELRRACIRDGPV